ncbi:unnamed protein product [Schistocephalus solidus]|uniref:Uncharacterized protein n=1 Tax=Schistocephalus solidus TaxID=70667 RepID=A0A183TFC2_SCHSO|nr:unnamed protein product [Schistocephalus solidus]
MLLWPPLIGTKLSLVAPRSKASLSGLNSGCPPRAVGYTSNELANRLAKLQVTNEDTCVENRWCQLKDTVKFTALAVLGHTCRQHQDWFADNDVFIHTLLAEKNQLQKAYVHCPTVAKKTAFYRSHRLMQ